MILGFGLFLIGVLLVILGLILTAPAYTVWAVGIALITIGLALIIVGACNSGILRLRGTRRVNGMRIPFFKKANWHQGSVYPQDQLAAKGYAAFPRPWIDNGAPPKFVLLGRSDETGKSKILRAKEINTRTSDIAVTRQCFDDLKARGAKGAAEQSHVEVRFRAAGFLTRVRYRPLDSIVAVFGLVGAIATAVAELVRGIAKPEVPLWLLFIVFIVATFGGAARFLQDLRKNDTS